MTRREKMRLEMLEEIKAIARRQMDENGTASISLSAISRELEVSQPALYRYYASRDDLLTTLILDAYNAQAAYLEETSAHFEGSDTAQQLLEVLLAYRVWALDHAIDYQLIYGNPIPGYHAPAEVTTPAAQRVFAVILQILMKAYQAGAIRQLPEPGPLPESLPFPLSLDGEQPLPPEVVYTGIAGWCRIHGIISLEMFHHTTPLLPEPGIFYRSEVESLLKSAGMEV
jgi:AcrR family transcriptional regulator